MTDLSSIAKIELVPEIGATKIAIPGNAAMLYAYENAVVTSLPRTEIETATAEIFSYDETTETYTSLATASQQVIPVVVDASYPLACQVGFTRESEHDYVWPAEAAQYVNFVSLDAQSSVASGITPQ